MWSYLEVIFAAALDHWYSPEVSHSFTWKWWKTQIRNLLFLEGWFSGEATIKLQGCTSTLVGGFKYLLFSSLLGQISNLANIFQMVWNHQLVLVFVQKVLGIFSCELTNARLWKKTWRTQHLHLGWFEQSCWKTCWMGRGLMDFCCVFARLCSDFFLKPAQFNQFSVTIRLNRLADLQL